MNRTRGFINLNRFKSGKTIKKLAKITDDGHKLQNRGKKTKE
ncbi:hypothetical protein ACFLWT_00350 [Chloroflexota bacterium]